MNDFRFSIPVTVRIGDINYGGHVGYHIYLLYFQEGRIAYLKHLGFSEHDIAGYGMVVAGVECRYKKELLLGEEFSVECRISELKSKAFIMEYRIVRAGVIHAHGMTANVCFDRQARKVARLPRSFVEAVRAHEGMTAESADG